MFAIMDKDVEYGMGEGYQEENLQKQKTREEDKDRNWEAGSSYVSDEHLAGTPGTVLDGHHTG